MEATVRHDRDHASIPLSYAAAESAGKGSTYGKRLSRVSKSWPMICLLAPLFCSCATETMNPELKARILGAKRVAIVAPDVEMIHYVYGGEGKRSPDESAKLALDFYSEIATELSKRGFAVKSAHLTKANIAQIKLVYQRMSYAYNMPSMPKTFDPAVAERFASPPRFPPQTPALSFGPECSLVADESGADALIFVKFQEFKRSAGSFAADLGKAFLIDVALYPITVTLGPPALPPPIGGSGFAIAFVEGKTGEVLWDNKVFQERASVSPAFATFPQ